MVHRLDGTHREVSGLWARLETLNPAAVLTRGYAIVRHRDTHQVLTSAAAVQLGMPLSLQFGDGEAYATGEAPHAR